MEKRITVVPSAAPRAASIRLSVYDIPLEVTSDERADGGFRLGFVYPDQEESVARTVAPQVSFRVGKHSGKIIGIDVAAGREPGARLGFLNQQIERVIPSLTSENQRLNYTLIRHLLQTQSQGLLGT